ncbi:MAG: hypothetical protein RR772_03490, partial [Gordonibacter sp.]
MMGSLSIGLALLLDMFARSSRFSCPPALRWRALSLPVGLIAGGGLCFDNFGDGVELGLFWTIMNN